MTRSTKVLILTAPFGSGHLQVSSALTEEFMKHENVIVEEYDLYSIVCYITVQAMLFMIQFMLKF